MANRLRAPKGLFVLAVILLGATTSVPHPALASPGLIPAFLESEAYVDFSGLPGNIPAEAGLEAWYADGWDRGSGSLQLVRAGAYLEAVIVVPFDASAAELTLAHRSGLAPGCPGSGFAPVTISVNGNVLASGFAPPVEGADGFSTARWEIGDRLVTGLNRIRITAGDLCSLYEIRSLRVGFSARTGSSIVASQMTHGIEGHRPIDSVAAFAPSDARAVCWTEVASEAIGRRIEFRFYDPSGALYFRAERTADRYNWGYILLAGWDAADRRGRWQVDVSVGGALQSSLSFSIGSVGASQRPAITGIEFPSTISADGKRVSGSVSFHDPDGDVTWVTFEAVDGLFSDFEFDPGVTGESHGQFSFYVYTQLCQHVTLKVILYDRTGNESEPYWFSFNAT